MAIRLIIRKDLLDALLGTIQDEVKKYINSLELRGGSEPGLAFLIGEVPKVLNKLYLKALTDFVHRDFLLISMEKAKKEAEIITPFEIGHGLVGALASIGWPEGVDCTYELLAYRTSLSSCEPRCLDEESVVAMDKVLKSETFLNYDPKARKILIAPHGPDPVLLGIRGNSPKSVLRAYSMIKVCEKVSGYMIFRTNQGTNAHHVKRKVTSFHPYQTGCVEGVVVGKPVVFKGGATVIELHNNEGSIKAVFFRETGLNKISTNLMEGDVLEVCGTAHLWENVGTVVNVEKLTIKSLIRHKLMNPRCPKCGARMKSAGKDKGWKCPKCGYRAKNLPKEVVPVVRRIKEGIYLPYERAFKHLMKPASRYGKESKCGYTKPIEGWIR